MDQSVLEAIARWPNVPAVTGWLSLTARGQWRLHPNGDATTGGPGEHITNEQILGFIDRNYEADARGAWYFQNGPQRVYVRLDAAPYILRFDPTTGIMTTHNGLTVDTVTCWYADDEGHLFANTRIGAGRVDDRDLCAVADRLTDTNGLTLPEILESAQPLPPEDPPVSLRWAGPGSVGGAMGLIPLRWCARADIPKRLGFIANPLPSHA